MCCLAAACRLARDSRRGAAQPRRARPARLGLAVAGVYMRVMLGVERVGASEVRRGLDAPAGRQSTRFMVTPVFANPLRREVIVDTGDRYEKGLLWFEPLPHFRPAGYGVDINSPIRRRSRPRRPAVSGVSALVALSVFRRSTARRRARACI